MSEANRPPVRLPVGIAIWIALAAVFTMSAAAVSAVKGTGQTLWESFWWGGADWLFYGILSPAVFWLVSRLALSRSTWLRAVPPLLVEREIAAATPG